MYKLLRRISSSLTGFDWKREGGDAGKDAGETSSATPQTGSKRRMSDDDDDVPNGSLSKRSRGHTHDENNDYNDEPSQESDVATPAPEGESQASSTAPGSPKKETEGVRQVTKGVKEVELEDKMDKGKGKVVVEDAREDGEKEEEEEEEESGVEKNEDEPSAVVKTDEDPSAEGETVADAQPAADVVTDSSESAPEPSKDDTLVSAKDTAIPDASETPSSPKDTQVESSEPSTVDATDPSDLNTIPATSSFPRVDGTSEIPAHAPTIIAEPLVKLTSEETSVKVQG